MSRPKPSMTARATVERMLAAVAGDKPVREEFSEGGRLHVDRPLPFLCVHLGEGREQPAARDVAAANASYLIAPDAEAALPLVEALAAAMAARFGAFLLLDVGELARDRFLSEDAPFLPPFEITVSATRRPGTGAARDAFVAGIEGVEARFRTPRVAARAAGKDPAARLAARMPDVACLTVRFAPIYRVPESEATYPDLRNRVVANIFDAGLRAVAAFAEATGGLDAPPTHRALGRRAFVDAVGRADRAIDEVASSFDFLLAVTPINAAAAWREFDAGGRSRAPRFLYRPLTVAPDAEKRKLFSVSLDHFEDPVLFDLYREKQQELDLQLSMLLARETPRFVEIGRALYGPVEPPLLAAAQAILAGARQAAGDGEADRIVDAVGLAREAAAMIEAYRRADPGFTAAVELRDDLPPGMMVVDDRLLVASGTAMARGRVGALLSHEVGVHLLTWFNGSAQGLRLFRSGLAGYEGMQEGLAVFAEYLAGGMTPARLRLIAARVVACAAMLDGATFPETFRLLARDHGFSPATAFNVALRLHRGGGLAKDAIYLRGLLQVLAHLRGGGPLDPFWMGKIAASHFAVMQELSLRGLLKPPRLRPAFLSHPKAAPRLERARAGLSPLDMIPG